MLRRRRAQSREPEPSENETEEDWERQVYPFVEEDNLKSLCAVPLRSTSISSRCSVLATAIRSSLSFHMNPACWAKIYSREKLSIAGHYDLWSERTAVAPSTKPGTE